MRSIRARFSLTGSGLTAPDPGFDTYLMRIKRINKYFNQINYGYLDDLEQLMLRPVKMQCLREQQAVRVKGGPANHHHRHDGHLQISGAFAWETGSLYC